jgi:hypothetical protein
MPIFFKSNNWRVTSRRPMSWYFTHNVYKLIFSNFIKDFPAARSTHLFIVILNFFVISCIGYKVKGDAYCIT